MAGVAQGDRILSQDVTAIMRRINAVEAKRSLVAITKLSGMSSTVEYSHGGSTLRTFPSGRNVGIWVDTDQNTFVTEAPTAQTTHRIRKFDTSNPPVVLFSSGSFGTGNGQFDRPHGIVTDGGGSIYVVDTGNTRVQKFTSSGVYTSQHGTSGSGDGEFTGPAGIAITSGGNHWVADFGNDRLQEFTSGGTYVSQFGTSGSGNGQFNRPQGVAIDDAGNLYVTDFNNDRVQKFTSGGSYTAQWGTTGTTDGNFTSPTGIAYWKNEIYVVDHSNRLQFFNTSGVFQMKTVVGTISSEVAPGDLGAQTTFYKYPTTSVAGKVSLGTPDGGVVIPALTALDGIIQRSNEVTDMHNAIEVVLADYINSVTGNVFNWTTSSADNLYHVAVESGKYDWDETGAYKTIVREDLIDKLDLCVTKLEASDLV